ncbi:hypothetical protein [Glaciibacter psychrotolerans]|uniref:Uncharacterized protein n=1 Tax=Glaciibacter psychrotolerans TaxID=670054 RepID=A0A7Z0EC39_9MICO|nr:hypothetical protein [Leifsonia psychrotolerans]NYJ18778.1 hypothetical protein [Leifsonia psychrotolerans]
MAAEHGASARIVAAERITQGGIGGFLAKHFVEVTVEVEAVATPTVGMALPNRAGIAALLIEADDAEDLLHGTGVPKPVLSTSSADFDALYDGLNDLVGPAPVEPAPLDPAPLAATVAEQLGGPAGTVASSATFPVGFPAMPRLPVPAPIPAVKNGIGDLVLIIGLRTDSLRVAHSLAGRAGPAAVCVGGSIVLDNVLAVTDRRTALRARAEAVRSERSGFVAYGIEPGADWGADIAALEADQVWVVVDAGRKHEDTQAWVSIVAASGGIDAVAVLGLAMTTTPETVSQLGAPVAWADGRLLRP